MIESKTEMLNVKTVRKFYVSDNMKMQKVKLAIH